jgi:hypothetical protein
MDDESGADNNEEEEEDERTPFERLPEEMQKKIRATEKILDAYDDMMTVVVFDQSPPTLEEKILGKERRRVPINVRFHLKTCTVKELKTIVLEKLEKEVNEKTLHKVKLIKNGAFMHPDKKLVKDFLTLDIDRHFCNRHAFGWRKPYAGPIWLVPNHIEPSNDAFHQEEEKEEEKVEVKKRTMRDAVKKYRLGTMLLRNPMKWKKDDGRKKLEPVEFESDIGTGVMDRKMSLARKSSIVKTTV